MRSSAAYLAAGAPRFFLALNPEFPNPAFAKLIVVADGAAERDAFGFVALLGLIGLAGILMRNTLILANQIEDNLHQGLERSAAVVEARVQRARPVVLTAAAVFAFIPLTTDTFWGPLAFVLIGGVLVGTLITLLFLPALYALCRHPRPAAMGGGCGSARSARAARWRGV